MIDINKQVDYWRSGAEEDFLVAEELVTLKRIRHGLFFAHLALEKMLKAHVCRQTGNLAPPSHNLVMLAQKAGIKLEQRQLELLAEVNEFSIEGRYPELHLPLPAFEEVKDYLFRIKELLEWLKGLLN